jgi:hypothetical protein
MTVLHAEKQTPAPIALCILINYIKVYIIIHHLHGLTFHYIRGLHTFLVHNFHDSLLTFVSWHTKQNHTVPSSRVPRSKHTIKYNLGFKVLKVKKIKLFMCLTNWALRHEGIWRSGCTDPHFLDLDTSWRQVVSFTPWPLYPQYPFDRRLGRSQSRSEQCGEEKILDPTRTQTPTPQSSSP